MNPTDLHKEQARVILREWMEAHGGGTASLDTTSPQQEDLRNRIASALSFRDAEIREVLIGLSSLRRYDHGRPERCWCDAWVHTPACLAARELYNKLRR